MIFGTQDDQQTGMVTSGAPADDSSFTPSIPSPVDDTTNAAPAPAPDFSASPAEPIDFSAPPSSDVSADTNAPDTVQPTEPSVIEPMPPASDSGALNNSSVSAALPGSTPDDLLDLKQKALSDLGPLVEHLDQTPEEKFRTTMMLIQSTDNQQLLKDAYAAAQAIPDEKVRAQALLDVVNEINYFTHQSQS